MHACVVKNSEGTWDVFAFLSYPSSQEKQDRLDAAVESGLPITGMVLTEYKWSATNGAFFNGTEFVGGSPSVVPQDNDWLSINTFGYLCDNIIIGAFITTAGTLVADQYNAAFSDETTIIKVPEGQTAKIGDIWDGQKIVNRVE
jgi:hypothetical protein